MKKNFLATIFVATLVFINLVNAQSTGDYRTKGVATFSSATNWEVFNGSWGAASTAPATPASAVTTQATQTSFSLTTTGSVGTNAANTATVNGAVSSSITFIINTPLTGSVPVAGQPITGTGIGTNNYITAYDAGTKQVTVNVAVTLANAITVSYGSQLSGNSTIELTNVTAGTPAVGMPISGTGIPSSSYVTAVSVGGNANCITISVVPTSTRTGSSITFLGIGASPNYNVYLSASNASIAVGQRVTGTGIIGGTTVAAISGRALTLSQPAYTSGSNITLSFYTAATIPNMYINHTTSIDATAIPTITHLFINDASSTNAGTGAVYSNNNSGFTTSSVVALTVGDVTVASGSTFGIIGGTAKHTLTFTGTGTIISNLGGINFFTNTTKNVGLYIASSGSSTISSSASLQLYDITVVSGSSLVLPSSSISVASSITNNGSGITTTAGGTIVFNGATSTVATGTIGFNNVTINSGATFAQSSVTINIAGNLVCNGTITGSSTTTNFTGTTAITGTPTAITFNSIAIAASSSLTAHSGTMNITGSFTNNGTFTHNNGTLNFTGTSSTLTLGGSLTGSNSFNKMIFNGSGATWTFNAAADVASDFTITLGTVKGFAGASLSIAGNFVNNGTFTHNSGTVNFYGTTALSGTGAFTFYNVTIAASSSLTPAASSSFTVNNNWTNNGTFTHNNSTVNFGATTSQTIAGNTTFYNFTKNVTAASTLTLTSGTTQTFAGALTISGASNAAILTIKASTTGSQASITPTSVAGKTFLKVTDINNTSTAIATSNSSSGGNNINWTFPTNTWTGATNTNWNTATNWSLGVVPSNGDNVIIATSGANQLTTEVTVTIASLVINDGNTVTLGGFTFTVSGTTTVGNGLSGVLTIGSATSSKTFTGLFTVSAGGSFTNPSNFGVSITFRGGITNDGTFSFVGGGTIVFDTNSQIIAGSGTMNANSTTVTSPCVVTNNGTYNAANGLSGTGSWLQGTNGYLYFGSISISITAFDASTNVNTVNYNRNNSQTIFATNYYHLIFSSTNGSLVSRSIQAGTTSILGDFTLSGTANVGTTPANLAITGNFSVGDGCQFAVGGFNLSVGGTTTIGGGTSGSLTFNSSSGTKTFTGNVTINAGGTMDHPTRTHSPTFGGNLTNAGTLILGSSGTYSIAGSFSNSGTFTANGATVTMTATSSKSISGSFTGTNTFFALSFNGISGAWSLPASLDVASTFTITNGSVTATTGTINIGSNFSNAGTFTSTSGSLNIVGSFTNTGTFSHNNGTVVFTGTTKTLTSATGSSNTTFYNLTFSSSASITCGASTFVVANNLAIGDGCSFSISNVFITVTGTTTIGEGGSGSFSLTSTTGTKIFTGLVTIRAGASWTETANTTVTFQGGITNAGTFTAGNGVHTFNTNNQILTGTLTIPSITITSVSLTNTNTLNVSSALTGTSSTFIQGSGSTLNYSSTSNIGVTTLNVSATGNTVNYNSTGAQTILAGTYYHLTISGARTTNNVTTSTSAIRVLGTFNHTATYTSGAWSPSTGTVHFQGTDGNQSITSGTSVPFYNLVINNASGVTLSDNVRVTNQLTLTSGRVTTGVYSVTLTNNASSTAALAGTPSTSSYIDGTLIRTVSDSYTGYVFPVGHYNASTDNYYPFTLNTLNTSGASVTVTVNAYNASAGGSAGTLVSTVSTNEYWQVTASAAFTSTISLATAVLGANEIIAASTTLAGAYNSILGTVSGSSIVISSSTSIPTGSNAYFLVATSNVPAPSISGISSDIPGGTTYYSGSVLTISGNDFDGSTTVVIGGQTATISSFTSTQIVVTVPSGVVGNNIGASNAGGTGNYTGTYVSNVYLSSAAGDYNTASNWGKNEVPVLGSTVIVRHNITINATPANPANLTINSGVSLALGISSTSNLTVTGNLVNNGTLTISSTSAVGQFTLANTGTFSNTGTITVGSASTNIYGYLFVNGAGTNSGTITINNGSTSASLILGAALANSGTITNNTIVQINSGGSVSGNGIVYAVNANLYYNQGADYTPGTGAEWLTGTSSSAQGDAGIPYNVQVGKSQTGTLNSNTKLKVSTYLKAAGTFTTNTGYTTDVNNGYTLNAGKISNIGTLNVGTTTLSALASNGGVSSGTVISNGFSSPANSGTINIYGYFINASNTFTQTGTINVKAYAVLELSSGAPQVPATGSSYDVTSLLYFSGTNATSGTVTSFNFNSGTTAPTLGNVLFNVPTQTSSPTPSVLANIAGTFYVLNTGTGSIRPAVSNTFGGLQLGGSYTINGATLTSTATDFRIANTTGLTTQVNGDININTGATLGTTSATTVSLTGNWTNTGTFTTTSIAIVFNGTLNQNIGTTTFPANVTINNAAGVTATGAVSVASTGTLALTSGVFSLAPATATTCSLPCTITRTSGTIDASNANATLAFTGSSARTIPASIFSANINALTINNSGGVTLNADATVNNTLTLTAGTLTLGSNLTLKGGVSVTSGNISATAGTVTYNGTAAQTLTVANYTSSAINALVVNNSNGVSITGNLTNTGSLTLIAGTLTTTGTLTLNGSTSVTSGNINASAATVVYSGASAQTIPAGTYTGNVLNLTINNAAGVTLGGTLNIAGTLTPTAGTLTTGGYLVIRSTSTGTGRIAQGSGSYISGDVTVERFIPAKATRKYSFIASPVTQLIRNGWQQQMYITGAGTGGTTCGTTTGNGVAGTDKYNSNGFDKTITNTPSLYYYNISPVNGTRWTTISNTTSTSLTPGKGYRSNIRGDRNLGTCNDQLLANSPAAPTDVTLSASGTVTTGDLTVNLNAPATHLYTLVGNPYPSAISFTAFKADNTTISNKLWSYSPNGNGNYTTYAAGIIANAATGYNNTNGDYIASGQAFFVEANNTGSTVLFKESHKTTGTIPNNQYFGLLNNQIIRVGLKNTNLEAIDEVVVRFANTGSKNYLTDVDAVSFGGGNQYLQTIKPAYKLAIATRPANFAIDTVQLAVMSNATGDFVLNMNSIDGFDGSTVITLRDKFLGTTQDVVANPAYAFSVTNDSLSKGINRFELVFKQTTTLPVQFVAIKATKEATQNHINWTVANEKNLQSYEVEKSTDGVHYVSIATVKATNDASYSSNDLARTVAKTIYYRIKAIDQDGTTAYSKTATITNNPAVAEYTVSLYPMPVKAQLQIALNNASADKYSIQIKSMDGKAVWSKSGIAAEAGILQIDVHQLAAGTYSLFLTDSNGQQTISKLVKE